MLIVIFYDLPFSRGSFNIKKLILFGLDPFDLLQVLRHFFMGNLESLIW